MSKNYNLFLNLLILLLFGNLLSANRPDILKEFVENHLIVVKSKMKDSPNLWLDVKEGYLRNKIIFFSEEIMDSLDNDLSGYKAAIRHLPKIEILRKKVLSGKEFEYNFKTKIKPNYRKNYFSSSNN